MRRKFRRRAELIALDVRDVAFTGEGVAVRDDGEVVFVAGALAGEKVCARLGPPGSPRRAELVKVLAESPARVTPPCAHARSCGGCDLMHVSPREQRRLHVEGVMTALAGAFTEKKPWRELLPEPIVHTPQADLGYRTRARLHVESDGRRARVGYRAPRSHRLTAIDGCLVLSPALAPAIEELARLLASSRGRGEVQAALGCEGRRVYSIRWQGEADGALLSAAERDPGIAGVELWLEGAREALSWGDPRPLVQGGDGRPLSMAPGGFAQASDEGGVALARRVAALAGPAERAVELFAGSGTLTVALAPNVERYLAVESQPAAAAALRANTDARGLSGVQVKVTDANAFDPPRPLQLAVLDPPRAGAAGAVQRLAAARPRRIVYVSCNAVTLARDLAVLLAARYRIENVELFELFPQTSHVEVVVALGRDREAS